MIYSVPSGPFVDDPADRADGPPDPTHMDLVRAAQGGDQAAFTILVDRHHNAVAAVAYALTGRFALSEDIAQETFLLAWRRLPEIERPERFRAWLLGVARKKSLHALRDQRTALGQLGLPSVSNDVPSPAPSPLERAISHQEEEFLWSALRKIPEAYRVPLVMFYREQKSLETVAAMLGLSGTNLRQRLTRGRRMLHQHVEDILTSALNRSRLGKRFTAGVAAALLAAGARPATAAGVGKRIAGLAGTRAWTTRLALGVALTVAVAVAAAVHRFRDTGSKDGAIRHHEGVALGILSPSGSSKRGASVLAAAAAERHEGGPGEPEGTSILAFDFEDGLLPGAFVTGHVVPGPPRTGNRYALMATLFLVPGANEYVPTGVVISPSDLHYRSTLAISFDYWNEYRGITVEIWNKDRQSNYYGELTPNAVPGWKGPTSPADIYNDAPTKRWAHVFLPLSRLVPAKEVGGMQPGDQLSTIKILAGAAGGPPFFIDNLRIVDSAE